MKIRIWKAITDGGDGEHHSHMFKSKEEMLKELDFTIDSEWRDGQEGMGFDEYSYLVQFEAVIFDTEGYEVVE